MKGFCANADAGTNNAATAAAMNMRVIDILQARNSGPTILTRLRLPVALVVMSAVTVLLPGCAARSTAAADSAAAAAA